MATAMSPASELRSSSPLPDSRGGIAFDLVFEPAEEGGFSVLVLNLPGAVSEGDTLDEATDNIREAIQGLLEAYSELNLPIPWRDSSSMVLAPGSISKRIWIDG